MAQKYKHHIHTRHRSMKRKPPLLRFKRKRVLTTDEAREKYLSTKHRTVFSIKKPIEGLEDAPPTFAQFWRANES